MDEMNQSVNSTSSSASDKINSVLKKKRNSNFSRDEINSLLIEYEQRASALNFGTREQKQKTWEDITTEINNLHPDFIRTVTEVKKKWIDLLHATKKEYVKATKEAEKLGKLKRRPLSDIAEMIVKVRGGFSKDTCVRSKRQVINFEISEAAGENGEPTTTFYVPVNSGDDSNSDIDSPGKPQNSTLTPNLNESGEVSDTMVQYETYGLPVATALGCACGLAPDLVRLKQEAIGIMKRKIQIEEERRIEEKQKWWEEKALMRLQRQKLELEIKQLKASTTTTIIKK